MIDFENKIITLKQSDSFTTKSKRIPVNGDWISKSFKRAIKAVGLNPKIHFHAFSQIK